MHPPSDLARSVTLSESSVMGPGAGPTCSSTAMQGRRQSGLSTGPSAWEHSRTTSSGIPCIPRPMVCYPSCTGTARHVRNKHAMAGKATLCLSHPPHGPPLGRCNHQVSALPGWGGPHLRGTRVVRWPSIVVLFAASQPVTSVVPLWLPS